MSNERVASIIKSRNCPPMEMGRIMQLAAEAGSESKLLIDPDPAALYGEHHDLVLGGLRAIANGQYGNDYHGVVSCQAANLLDDFGQPLETEATS